MGEVVGVGGHRTTASQETDMARGGLRYVRAPANIRGGRLVRCSVQQADTRTKLSLPSDGKPENIVDSQETT